MEHRFLQDVLEYEIILPSYSDIMCSYFEAFLPFDFEECTDFAYKWGGSPCKVRLVPRIVATAIEDYQLYITNIDPTLSPEYKEKIVGIMRGRGPYMVRALMKNQLPVYLRALERAQLMNPH